MDLTSISDAFVVVVVGGMGSIPGALLASVIVGMARAICMGVPTITVLSTDILLSKLSLVVDFVVMASVLIVKPRGLFGRIEPRARTPLNAVQFVPPTSTTIFLFASLVVLALVPAGSGPYFLVFMTTYF